MKSAIRTFLIAASLPLVAFAGVRDDYAQQWPLTLGQADAGAYRVVLDSAVYQQLQSPALKDLVVTDVEGTPVAAALFDAEQPIAKAAGTKRVPWFALPSPFDPQPSDIASISEIGADGSLRRVTLSNSNPTSNGVATSFLVDISRLREPVHALQIAWIEGQETFDRPYRVSASDDLKRWRTVQDDAHLIELRNKDERIVRNRIEFQDVQAKYLRLDPLCRDNCSLDLVEVFAEPTSVATQSWQWQDLAGKRVVSNDGSVFYEYEVKGRFPFELADLLLIGNSTNEWVLQSRDDQKKEWEVVAPQLITFQLEGPAARSPPQALDGLRRDHYWRLQATNGPVNAAPTLRLGYRPEVVIFLAQAKPPYALLAGSARSSRVDAPLTQLLNALRAQRGQDWQPATATLGSGSALSGAQTALTPAPVERDWKAWLLWALLIGGALMVAGFAFSLLKKPVSK